MMRKKNGKKIIKPRNIAHQSLFVLAIFLPKSDRSNKKKFYKRNKKVEDPE